ncbi:Plant tudor-like rna-binding protein [Thalictrum thalictroides]|uniref:Plant tudor-like rna-binding protein n=1 Tax=Thalictrum thalictroides TaxID=46969 RepID=A0A7J6VY67_THATH|nr:Plant tudor-like rna-binding protein [Thalictrum thalictroides]
MRFRFHKGDRVEVFSKKEVPTGSWRCGLIVSGNGHTYYIQYESAIGITDGPITERIPRKAIRPCPPVDVIESWADGDFVEVFDNASWKLATVSKVKDMNRFQVKLLGTNQKVEVYRSQLRLPQSWQEEEWVVIQKVSVKSKYGNSDHLSTKSSYHKSMDKDSEIRYARDGNFPIESEAGFQVSHLGSSKTLKRGAQCNLSHGVSQKLRAMEKDGKLERMVTENYKHVSIKNRGTGFSEINMEKRKRNVDTIYSAARSFEPNDAERSVCSVGSSGTSNKEEIADETHKLALDAYYNTMESLREYGYISWEQEEMITDLRMKLNISNDDHLMELRKLVAAQ